MSVPLQEKTLLRHQGYINGQWQDADNHRVYPVINPATGETLATVADMGARETEAAIAAADQAWPAWRALTAKARSEILKRWFGLIHAHAEDLAQLITAEQGKPLAESRGEVGYGASFIEWFAEEAKRAYGSVIPSPLGDRMLLTLKQPIGVCAAITPWNFPLAMITRKVAPALAAGCTVVCKPAEATPLTALALAVQVEKAQCATGCGSKGLAHHVTQFVTQQAVLRAVHRSGELVEML